VRGDDREARLRALDEIALENEDRASNVVFELLIRASDRETIEAAGLATQRMFDRDGVPLLQDRADEGPDDIVRARLIHWAARLNDRQEDLTGWLKEGLRSDEPWRRAGSAVGLLQSGRPEGGEWILTNGPVVDPKVRAFAMKEFTRIARPMAEAVGQCLPWEKAEQGELAPAEWTELRAFWERYGTERLLNDVLNRLERRDEKWHQVNRLIHARNKLARFFD
jgi:hypothetical protein